MSFSKSKNCCWKVPAQGHKLIQDVPTRWNSSLDMLKRLLEQSAALQATLLDKSLSKRASELQRNLYEEMVIVGHLVEVLEGFKTATEMLSPEKTPSHHLILPVMKKLCQGILIEENDISIVKKVKKEMKSQLEDRFGPEIDVALIASLLHPKTKHLSFLSTEEREKAHALLLVEAKKDRVTGCVVIKKEKDEENQDATSNKPVPNLPELSDDPESLNDQEERPGNKQDSDPVQASKKRKVECDWLDDIIVGDYKEAGHIPEDVLTEQEVQRYLVEDAGGNTGLDWWKEKEIFYPRVAKVAKKFLAIPASSVPSERVFSLAGNIVRKKRSQLSPENVDKMIFLHKNSKA
ncbi:E3 SUMO-protein ligase ZBED1-like [Argopecten irradians]|uniref:E3 SUMO-protein ligase ZBED1-like n=1 Tax=Argopecten irradians TaxID=31199 RepID=UPI00371A1985